MHSVRRTAVSRLPCKFSAIIFVSSCAAPPSPFRTLSASNPPRSAFFSLPDFPSAPVPRAVTFRDVRVVPYPSAIVIQTVCDVGRYKEFLPWVEDSRVLSTLAPGTGSPAKGIVASASGEGNIAAASLDSSSQLCELRVGFGPFTERYTSRVTVSHMPDGSTVVKATAGDSSVFSMLVNEWSIQPSARPGSSIVKFYVTFKFKSPAYAAVAEALFSDLSRRMAAAFELRFGILYRAKSA